MIPIVPPKPKKKLKSEKKSDQNKFKAALESKFDNIKANGLNVGKTALIAGGIAFAGYLLIDLITGKNKTKNRKAYLKIDADKLEKKKTKDSWIVASIKGYMMAFLIGIAREKIMEALAELKKDEAKADL
jgi:hypothetical protein